MTGKEWNNFELSDEKEYILTNNQEFMNWYNKKRQEGFESLLSIEKMQNLIYKIVDFYEFKYHNNLLRDVSKDIDNKDNYNNSKEIGKRMTIKELKYRLHNDELYFLGPQYPEIITINKENEDMLSPKEIFIRPEKEGTINLYDLERLQENKFLISINGIKTLDDLYSKLSRNNDENIDYSNLENAIYRHEINLEIRNKILNLIPLALIYSGGPIYGYIRALSFIKAFNKEYDLNLSTSKIDEIARKDYSKSIIEEQTLKVEKPKMLFKSKKK